ncbi:MAG: 3-keto-disaccharide hydrolase [Pirellulales bacterium]
MAADDKAEFKPIFDGKSLDGWHVSAKTGHGTGGRWVVEEGAIVGSQDKPGNGGIVITDKKYGDFEVVLEMKNDFGPDSGLFLRSTENGHAYQAMIDYHAGGNLMGVYGEGLSGGISMRNFDFGSQVTEIKPVDCPFKLPVLPEKWPEFWQHGKWNVLRARIVGNPPHVSTWINDVEFMDWTDRERRHHDTGGIALQVHGGGDTTRQFVRYRNIRIKELAAD